MSIGRRQRTRCHVCEQRCQVTPLEVMARGVTGKRGNWLWWTVVLCPPCQFAQLHQLGKPRLLVPTYKAELGAPPSVLEVELEANAEDEFSKPRMKRHRRR